MSELIDSNVAGTSILVVDDEPANLSLLTDILGNAGYKIYVAPSGKLALSSVSLNAPDIILLDILMPELDGYEVCRQLKADYKSAKIPVLFISALDSPIDKVRAFEVGAVDYISKPFHDKEVLARVKAHLSQYRANEKLQQQVELRTIELEQERRRVARLNQLLQDDIIALKYANQAIEDSERRYRKFLEAAPEAVMVVDENGEIELVNKKISNLFGYLDEDLIGQSAEMLLPSQLSPQNVGFCHLIADLNVTDDVGTQSFTGQKISGEAFPVDVSVSPVETDYGIRFIADIRDLTERQQLEEQLRQSQKLEVIGHLTAGVAHDFNNILASILGYTSLAMMLKDKLSNEKLDYYLAEINRSGERARDLVAQMLTFSRIEKPTGQKNIDLAPVIKGVLDMLRPILPSTISLVDHSDSDIQAVVADSGQISQVVMNLCVNASDAIFEHGKIEVTARTVRGDHGWCSSCHQLVSGDFVELVVSDSGAGITEDQLQRIFDPFFTTKEVGRGTGMGLSIVHGILHSHQGHIKVSSSPGKGSSFHLFLPVAEAETVLVNDHETKAVDVHDGHGRHILVVDDEEVIGLFFKEYLEMQGYKVSCYSESRAAFEVFSTNPHDYDLVITDQTMPEMTGRELARQIREIRSDLPIILCTGYDVTHQGEDVRTAGISAVIKKPVSCKELLSEVESLLFENEKPNAAIQA